MKDNKARKKQISKPAPAIETSEPQYDYQCLTEDQFYISSKIYIHNLISMERTNSSTSCDGFLIFNHSLDTVKNSSGITNVSLQIHLLYIQFIYYAEDDSAVRQRVREREENQ